PREESEEAEPQLLSTLAGAAIWILVMTLTARLPVQYSLVWAALLALPILVDLRGAKRRLLRMWQLVSGAELRGYGERSAFAAVVFVLLAHWFVALKPETSADALAMHLAIPANIAANHQMTFEPSRFVWAVMPRSEEHTSELQS